MNLFEYQAKKIFRSADLPVPEGVLIERANECRKVIQELGCPVVLKAQVPVGKRGQQGGIKMANSMEEAELEAQYLFSHSIQGIPVKKVLIEKKIDIRRECYMGITIDTVKGVPMLIFGAIGGIGVEDKFQIREELFQQSPIDPCLGLQKFQLRNILQQLDEPQTIIGKLISIGMGIYQLFTGYSATLIEVNPLILDMANRAWCADARLSIDDNVIQKFPWILELIHKNPIDFAQENIKVNYGFDYVELDPDGNVGLITTGAGLTMSVIDELHQKGDQPINFVDIRTGALRGDPTRIEVVLDHLMRAPNLEKLLVNVFAGITDLAEFSKTFLMALNNPKFSDFPKNHIVVRIEGNNVEQGERVLREAGIKVFRDLSAAIVNLADTGGEFE
jgi:succinyl-CoA synthetase beta subunit